MAAKWSSTTGIGTAMLAVCVACSPQRRGEAMSFGGGTLGGQDEATGSATSDSAGSQADSGGDGNGDADPDGDGVLLDVGAPTPTTGAGDGPGGEGCDKVDFLFIIDNSKSMEDEQVNLISSFPGFLQTIRETVNAQDYQIMVVDTDATNGTSSTSTCTNGVCTCSPIPACCDSVCTGAGGSCNGFDCDNLPGGTCDATLGAGKVFREDGTACLPTPGPRFMEGTDPDLDTTFACVARVGTFGSGMEQPMEALHRALTDPLAAPGGCNEGFLRDDAILVVTFITDEEDKASPGTPADWKDQLVAAKGGNVDAVVVLGLFGDNDQPDALCGPFVGFTGAEAGIKLRAFTAAFGDRGVIGSVCAPNYGAFFQDAVGVIDLACDEFEPEG